MIRKSIVLTAGSQPDSLACFQSENKLFYTFHISDGGVAAEAGAAAPASNIGGGGIEWVFLHTKLLVTAGSLDNEVWTTTIHQF